MKCDRHGWQHGDIHCLLCEADDKQASSGNDDLTQPHFDKHVPTYATGAVQASLGNSELLAFSISTIEQKAIDDWDNTHKCSARGAGEVGAIGGRLTLCFTPTSLGGCSVIKCACGEKLDITEYEKW